MGRFEMDYRECRHGRPECECTESFFVKKAKEYEVKMSENWCREGCCSPIQNQKIYSDNIAVAAKPEVPIFTSLNYLSGAIEGLEYAIAELDRRLQVVSSQAESPYPGLSVSQDKPGTSDVACRIGTSAEMINGLEARVQRMTRELEI